MGRQQYLIRLALGRSAFEDPPEDTGSGSEGSQADELKETPYITIDPDKPGYHQQYDQKGRPINPATEARNAAMRKAQNDVLALVGVVERKEAAYAEVRITELFDDFEGKTLRAKREHEHDRGEELDALSDTAGLLAQAWPIAVTERIQIGRYGRSTTFAHLVASEWRGVTGKGWRAATAALLPGMGPYMLHKIIWHVAGAGIEESISWLQHRELTFNWRRRTVRRLHAALTVLSEVLLLAVDVALLPLQYYAIARQLDLTPAIPIRLLLTSVLPDHFTSFHTYAWRSPTASPLCLLVSPAALLFTHSVMLRDADETAPMLASFTNFRYVPINKWFHTISCPKLHRDPCGALLWHMQTLRTQILRWCGWNIRSRSYSRIGEPMNDARNEYANDVRTRIETGEDAHGSYYPRQEENPHRSTALAHLPARWLGMRIDWILVRLVLLPFETLMLRSLATSLFNSSLPRTSQAVEALPRLLAPLPTLRNALSGLARWEDVASHASKLGLGFALQISTEALLFGGVYGLVRWQGRKNFGWRKVDKR